MKKVLYHLAQEKMPLLYPSYAFVATEDRNLFMLFKTKPAFLGVVTLDGYSSTLYRIVECFSNKCAFIPQLKLSSGLSAQRLVIIHFIIILYLSLVHTY